MCSFYETPWKRRQDSAPCSTFTVELDSRKQDLGCRESGVKGEMGKALGEIHALAAWRVWSGQFFATCDAILTARRGLLAQTHAIHAGGPSSYHPE
jgi:hypothetical protein